MIEQFAQVNSSPGGERKQVRASISTNFSGNRPRLNEPEPACPTLPLPGPEASPRTVAIPDFPQFVPLS